MRTLCGISLHFNVTYIAIKIAFTLQYIYPKLFVELKALCFEFKAFIVVAKGVFPMFLVLSLGRVICLKYLLVPTLMYHLLTFLFHNLL